MSYQIGNLDVGVSFAGDVSGLQQALGGAGNAVDGFGKKTTTSLKKMQAEANQAEADVVKLGRSVEKLANDIKSAFVGGSVAVALITFKNKLMETASAITQAQVQLDKWNNGFKFGAGSMAGGAREMAFVRDEAQRLGLELGGATMQYMKMAAAARGTSMEGAKTREVFTSIAEAATVMGMSGEQSERAFMAIVQMMSKGKVQAEELRGQLGEHLPGAFAIAARAMGVTEAELNKLMETGQVVSSDFLPKFGAQLRKELAGSVEDATKSMQASLNRYETAWLTFKQNVAQAGAGGIISQTLNAASSDLAAMSTVMESARLAGKGFALQMNDVAGLVIARSSIGFIEAAAEGLNWTINALTGNVFGLNESIDLMPNSLKSAAQQSDMLGQRLTDAEAKLAMLQERAKTSPDSPFFRLEIAQTRLLIEELERAKRAKAMLSGDNYGNETRREQARQGDQALAASRLAAYQKLMADLATPQEKFTAELAKQKALLGNRFTPEVEARLRANFIKPVKDASAAMEADLAARRSYTLELVKQMNEAAKAEAEYQVALDARKFDEAFEADQQHLAAVEARIKAGRTALEQIEFETSLLALNTTEREVATAMRELERQGVVKGTEAYAAYAAKIEAAIRTREGKNAETKAAAEAAKAWQKASEDIERSLTDALMRGFESGKGFAEVLRDTVANMFSTLVLRPVVQAIVQPVAGSITGALGMGGQGGAMGAINTASSLYSAYGAAGTAGGFVGSLGSAASYGAAIGGQQGAMLAAQEMGMGTLAGSAGSIGAALPWIGAGLAVLSLIDSLDDSGTMHTGGMAAYSRTGGVAVGDAAKAQGLGFNLSSNDYQASTEQASAAMAQSIVGMLDATAATFGKQAGYWAATGFADDTSKDGAWAALAIKMGDALLVDWKDGADKWPGREFANGEEGARQYAAAVALDVRNLLLAKTPEWADTMLNALGDAPSIEQLGAVVGQINMVQNALVGMGKVSEAFANMGQATTTALIAAMGGAEAAVAGLSGYYANFYTEAERTEIATASLTTQFAELGQALPASREALRAMVDAAMKAGDPALAGKLVKLSGAFAALSPSIDDLAQRAQAASDRISQEGLNLHRQWLQTIGDQAALREYELSKIDPINQWLQKQIWAYEDQQAAAEQAAAAQQAAAQAAAEYAESLAEAQNFLTGIARTVREWIDARNATGGMPTENLASAQSSFAAQMALAKSGNRDALIGITSYADRLISAGEQRLGYMEGRQLIASVVQQLTELPGVQSTDSLMLEALNTIATNTGNTASNTGEDTTLTFDANDPLRSVWEATKASAKSTAELLEKVTNGTLGLYVSLAASHNAQGVLDIGANLWKAASLWGGDAPRVQGIGGATEEQIKASAASIGVQPFATGSSITTTRPDGSSQVVPAGASDADILALAKRLASDPNLTSTAADRLLAEAAKAAGVSPTQLATALSKPTEFVVAAASAAGVDLSSKARSQTATDKVFAEMLGRSVDPTGALAFAGMSEAQIRAAVAASPEYQSKNKFATGGAFTSGIVSRPTAFNVGLMGEAGPEAIMPLANIGGSLGVRYAGPDFSDFGRGMQAMADEIKALRAQVARLENAATSSATSNALTADSLRTIVRDGVLVESDPNAPLVRVEVVAP